LVVRVELAGLVVRVELAGLVVPAVSVGLAAEIAFPPCRVGAATDGNTIPSIVAGPLIRTEQPQTALAARRVAILSPSDKRALGNKLAGRVATSPAPAAEPVSAIAPAAVVSATGVERALTGLAEAGPTELVAVTFRAAAEATAMPLGVVRGDIADQALVAVAAGVLQAWDLEAVEASVEAVAEAVVVDGADK
jgi:hypothetical protein